MMAFWVAGIEISILFALNLAFGSTDITPYVLIASNCIIVPIVLLQKEKVYATWLIVTTAFWVRSAWIITRIHFSALSGMITLRGFGDAVGYQNDAILVSQNFELIMDSTLYGSMYSKVVGVFYSIVGSNMLLGEYLNVILALVTLVFLVRTLRLCAVNEKGVQIAALIFGFLPWGILVNVAMLRETMMITFLMISIYWFAAWFYARKFGLFVLCVLWDLAAASLHSGTIMALPVYLLYFAAYSPKDNRLVINPRKFASILISFALVFAMIWPIRTIFYRKFSTTLGQFINLLNYNAGGSTYLQNVKIDSLWDLIWYQPLKLFYFIFSPMLWDARGATDLVTIVADSAVYAVLICIFVYFIIKNNKTNTLAIAMFFISILLLCIYAAGTFNAGTAVRHRHKALPSLILAAFCAYPAFCMWGQSAFWKSRIGVRVLGRRQCSIAGLIKSRRKEPNVNRLK